MQDVFQIFIIMSDAEASDSTDVVKAKSQDKGCTPTDMQRRCAAGQLMEGGRPQPDINNQKESTLPACELEDDADGEAS